MLRNLLLGATAAVAATIMATSAFAATELVSSVGVYDWDTSSSTLGAFVTTGIIFNGDQLVFCVDLEHNIYVTDYNPPLTFDIGALNYTGGGVPIDEPTSNEIGQLANAGVGFLADFNAHTLNYQGLVDNEEAVQAAIWSKEYGVTFASNAADKVAIDTEIDTLLTGLSDNHQGRAVSLIAHTRFGDGVQNMVPGGFVPEPASWTLMIGGFGLAGAVLRRRRAAIAA